MGNDGGLKARCAGVGPIGIAGRCHRRHFGGMSSGGFPNGGSYAAPFRRSLGRLLVILMVGAANKAVKRRARHPQEITSAGAALRTCGEGELIKFHRLGDA